MSSERVEPRRGSVEPGLGKTLLVIGPPDLTSPPGERSALSTRRQGWVESINQDPDRFPLQPEQPRDLRVTRERGTSEPGPTGGSGSAVGSATVLRSALAARGTETPIG